MATIASLRTALIAELDAKAVTYGENYDLDEGDMNVVSYGIDGANETWNENLPPRPHS